MSSFKNSTCERCLKHVAEHTIHTCTPTKGWLALETERDHLAAELKKANETIHAAEIANGNLCAELAAENADLRSALEASRAALVSGDGEKALLAIMSADAALAKHQKG